MSLTRPASPIQPPAELRQSWIAEAAYYRAQRRGFEDGSPLEDWLAAEREISTLPLNAAPRVALVFLE